MGGEAIEDMHVEIEKACPRVSRPARGCRHDEH